MCAMCGFEHWFCDTILGEVHAELGKLRRVLFTTPTVGVMILKEAF